MTLCLVVSGDRKVTLDFMKSALLDDTKTESAEIIVAILCFAVALVTVCPLVGQLRGALRTTRSCGSSSVPDVADLAQELENLQRNQ